MENLFNLPLLSKFTRHRLRPKTKEIVGDMVGRIKDAFSGNLETVKWMDGETRQNFKKKIKVIEDLIAYPNIILDHEKVEGFYKDLIIDERDYLRNRVRLSQFHRRLTTRIPLDNASKQNRYWTQSSYLFHANAFYSPLYNYILIPPGLLQPPAFHPDLPQSINFGSLGVILSHELLHGFDNQGKNGGRLGNNNDEFVLSFIIYLY